MTEPHDFNTLRAQRNDEHAKWMQKFADEHGVSLASLQSSFNPDSCYCACGTDGPCEHSWDGKPYESEDGLCWSATCSRCGMTCMSHDMRYAL